MVSALDSGLRGPGSSPGWGHCVVFSSMTLKEYNGTLNCQGNLMKCRGGGGGICDGLVSHPGGVTTILVASC